MQTTELPAELATGLSSGLSSGSLQLWQHFYALSSIPRPSRQEAAVRSYIEKIAAENDCECKMDSIGNLVVYVPASAGYQDRSAVVIQNHMDMVTVKTADSTHDFETDPLSLQISDGWLSANETTLGADNGIGCAAALALITTPGLEHPPLELLFTMDEETGLNGAQGLDATLLSGKQMLNLDTEDWHELYVGCAGGRGWKFSRDMDWQSVDTDDSVLRLRLQGLTGGHSGIQIHQQLGNANKLLADWLAYAQSLGVRVAGFHAGTAHNVIAREGEITFCCATSRISELEQLNKRLLAAWRSWLPEQDQNVTLRLEAASADNKLTAASQKVLVQWLKLTPHGALSYSRQGLPDLVNLSANLAMVSLVGNRLESQISCRFFNQMEAGPLVDQIMVLAELTDMRPQSILDYPGWNPDFDSHLLQKAKILHQQLFDIKPRVKAIHAGLECGILKSKMPDMDILSFGPTIKGAHSPQERVEIATVNPFWDFLTLLLKNL